MNRPDPATDAASDGSIDAALDSDMSLSCTANEFVGCEANGARVCNTTGDGTVTQDCGSAGCNADAKRCNQCVPSTNSCNAAATKLERCGADGLLKSDETCLLGCKASLVAHCTHLEPRYLPDICDVDASTPEYTIDDVQQLDTNIVENCTGGIIMQSDGTEICVVHSGAIHITSNGLLNSSGLGGRALALVADHALTVEGTIDVSANGRLSGPGGGNVISGEQVHSNAGGGGAGFATAGAPGGSLMQDGQGGHGGDPATNPALLTVLTGGRRPTPVFVNLGPGSGGGGGAMTLISCRGHLLVSGMIDAGGGGGPGGNSGFSSQGGWSGTGGGSGGNVVLQSLSISVTGQMFANGAGGGAGWVLQTVQVGQPGADGTRSINTSAPGGVSFGSEGAGGAGGRLGTPPTAGKQPNGSNGLPGGGGGAMGFFQTCAPAGATIALTPSAASPGFGVNVEIQTR